MRKELIDQLNWPVGVVIMQKKGKELSPLSLEAIPDEEFHQVRHGLEFVTTEGEGGNRNAVSDNGFGSGKEHVSYRILYAETPSRGN